MTISRRDLLTTGLAAGATAAIASPARATQKSAEQSNARRRVIRFANLTDAHVQPERGASDGLAACLEHAQENGAEFIVFGGDNLMNVDGRGRDSAKQQLEVYNAVVRDHCSLPHHHIVGNHDILALDPTDGKKWAEDAFGLDKRYNQFSMQSSQAGSGNWRFIALDSTSPEGGGYKGRLDEEQFDWLERTLRDIPRSANVCIVSHIPIVAVCAYFDGENEKTGDWRVPGAWMHIDARRLKDLFLKHPQVKLCLSGHMHLADTVEYLGVKYACNGAVSGAWWGGDYQEFAPGYGLIDLYDDGTSETRYVTYGWQTRE